MPVYDYQVQVRKHRIARHRYTGDFSPHLPEGVALSASQPEGYPLVQVLIPRIGQDINVSGQFVDGPVQVGAVASGAPNTYVTAVLKSAEDGEQIPGQYRLLFAATADDGETYVLVGRLVVTGGGIV